MIHVLYVGAGQILFYPRIEQRACWYYNFVFLRNIFFKPNMASNDERECTTFSQCHAKRWPFGMTMADDKVMHLKENSYTKV